ncbi:uncharacterized protein C10orf95-like [Corapipo altera]|uniref:uncharacterized protein C10orf95-like n=1 Tax=Corapipo altera TaxID=415028 RepID=UPI000FD690F6|nr:uncharacterized protein C10orf95-like [Corapipo altera]
MGGGARRDPSPRARRSRSAFRPASPRPARGHGAEQRGRGATTFPEVCAGESRQLRTERVPTLAAGLGARAAGRSGGTGGARLGGSRPGAGSGSASLPFLCPFSRLGEGTRAAAGSSPERRPAASPEPLSFGRLSAPRTQRPALRAAALPRQLRRGPAGPLPPAGCHRPRRTQRFGPAGREGCGRGEGNGGEGDCWPSPAALPVSPSQKPRCLPPGSRSPDGSSPRVVGSPSIPRLARPPPSRPCAPVVSTNYSIAASPSAAAYIGYRMDMRRQIVSTWKWVENNKSPLGNLGSVAVRTSPPFPPSLPSRPGPPRPSPCSTLPSRAQSLFRLSPT